MEEKVNSEIDQRVKNILVRVFRLSPVEGAEDLRMGSLPLWDSMGHMQLISEIEKEFDLRFPTYEISELLNTEAIIKAVKKYSQRNLPA